MKNSPTNLKIMKLTRRQTKYSSPLMLIEFVYNIYLIFHTRTATYNHEKRRDEMISYTPRTQPIKIVARQLKQNVYLKVKCVHTLSQTQIW